MWFEPGFQNVSGRNRTRSDGWDALERVLVKGSDGAQVAEAICDRPAGAVVEVKQRPGATTRPADPTAARCGCMPRVRWGARRCLPSLPALGGRSPMLTEPEDCSGVGGEREGRGSSRSSVDPGGQGVMPLTLGGDNAFGRGIRGSCQPDVF